MVLLAPITLSLFNPIGAAYFVIAFDLYWLSKSLRLNYFLIRGYAVLHTNSKINWRERFNDLSHIGSAIKRVEAQIPTQQDPKEQKVSKQYLATLHNLSTRQAEILNPDDIKHLVILTLFKEGREILEPTIRALAESRFPLKRIMLCIAYEERGGSTDKKLAEDLAKEFSPLFDRVDAIMHPVNLPDEIKTGKGPNISFACRAMTKIIIDSGLDPNNVIVTTLDADNRPDPNYLPYLSWTYATDPSRLHRSYQPIPMFYNNIWDVPAPMRVIATGSSFWIIVQAVRPHLLRNFASHAQGLQTLIDCDYWSRHSIVEDGHQYWRTYFRYSGNHKVVPLFTPVYQDAVLAKSYIRTFKAQYIQLRRWAWGVSDFPYAVRQSIKHPEIKWRSKGLGVARLLEGHISWATAPTLLTFSAWMPYLLNKAFSRQILAHLLPVIASRILSLTVVGLIITIFISLVSLPPRPSRYRRTKFLGMIAQWLLLPFTTIVFSAIPAFEAQTRLMLGKYLDFDVTEKAVK